jgi:hypothetical protein
MRQFITLDDKILKQYVLAGGDIPAQTRIEWMKQNLTGPARNACNGAALCAFVEPGATQAREGDRLADVF